MMETFYDVEKNTTQKRFINEVDKLCSKRKQERISALKQLNAIFYGEFNELSLTNLFFF